jgi:hypothetical protein
MPHPFFNFQGNAVLSILTFLGTGFLLLVLSVAVLFTLVTRRWLLARRFVQGGMGLAGLYLATLLVFSLASREHVLERNDAKYFCEIDCHLAYSVTDVVQTAELGAPPSVQRAHGVFYVVTVKTWFDERTISPHRGNGPLAPNRRAVWVIDAAGRQYGVSPEGQGALELSGAKSTPLTQALRPGESYTTTLVFDLPADIANPRLLICETDVVTRLLIGHENSFFHKKSSFRLVAREMTAAAVPTVLTLQGFLGRNR